MARLRLVYLPQSAALMGLLLTWLVATLYNPASCQALSPPIAEASSPSSDLPKPVVQAPSASPVAAPFSPITYETGTCDNTTPPASLSGWKRWSSLSTWPGQSQVPGTNGSSVNVTVECGDFLLYDMAPAANGFPAVQLGFLLIEGHLMFLDDPSLPNVALAADHVIVTGNLTIGNASQHFSQKATIVLTGNNMQPLTGFEGAGFKVLAAFGGQLNLFGMPGGGSTASWASLSQTATPGSATLSLDQDVTGWPIGGKVVVTSTDFDPTQAETATITAVNGNSITLDTPLTVSHFAPSVPTGVNNVSMPMAAEVALITRNILITATIEAAPNQLIGGHSIIYNTQLPQTIYGVEFSNMGQQGTLGRYPVHFHMCGPMPSSVVQKNSVHESFQRCYVVHGTHNMSLSDNVAFNTSGHCFMFEDGVEQNSTLTHNLAINSSPVQTLIPETPANTDDTPACFWSATPLNAWLNNTAVGCNSGFWLELNQAVRGISQSLPGANTINPYNLPLGQFADNTAHSHLSGGITLYVHGYLPNPYNQTFWRFKAYKNEYGMIFHGSQYLIIDGAMLSDNLVGVEFNEQSENTLQNSIILGQSANLGNPVNCGDPYEACEPASGACSADFNYNNTAAVPPPGTYRTVWSGLKQGGAAYGVVLAANTAVNNSFVNFNSTCHTTGAVGIDMEQPGAVPVTGLLRSNSFVNTPTANRVWIDPALGPYNGQYWVVQDQDGSTTGLGVPGWIVAGNASLLMPPTNSSVNCTVNTAWNAMACTDACYRTVYVTYDEPGLTVATPASQNGSYLNVTRVQDGATFNMFGTPLGAGGVTYNAATNSPVWQRLLYMNVLGAYTYHINIVSPTGALPPTLYFGYADLSQPSSPACSASAVLQFPSSIDAILQ